MDASTCSATHDELETEHYGWGDFKNSIFQKVLILSYMLIF